VDDKAKLRDLEMKLDRLLKEVESLRQEIRRAQPKEKESLPKGV
jgi:hypothetical protein